MASTGSRGVRPLGQTTGPIAFPTTRLGRSTDAHAPVDDLQGERNFGERALQRIEPAGPSVERAALYDQGVEKDEDGRRPPHQAYPIGPPEASARCRQEIVGLAPGVVLL